MCTTRGYRGGFPGCSRSAALCSTPADLDASSCMLQSFVITPMMLMQQGGIICLSNVRTCARICVICRFYIVADAVMTRHGFRLTIVEHEPVGDRTLAREKKGR